MTTQNHDIYVEKTNESTLRVFSNDFGIEAELSEHFSFYAPGYKFAPTYRAKVWDGKVALYNQYKKTLPYGLLSYLSAYAKNNNYSVNIQEGILPEKNVSIEEVKAFVDTLNIHTKGKKIELRDYQLDAIHKAINTEKLLALSPTSSGKSAIIYAFVRWHLQYNRKIVLMVPTTSLVTQMYSDFGDYSSEDTWNVEEHCHQLYSGKSKDFEKPVLITTWQSVHSLAKKKGPEAKEFYEYWDVYIGDEAHRFASNSLQQISNKLVNAKYRLGTTGTIQDEKVSKLNLEGSFGPVYKVVTTKELMDKNQVVNLKINCIVLDYDKETKKLLKNADYQSEIDYIVGLEKRNTFIAKLAKVTKGNTLVLFRYVEKHGKPLYEEIKRLCPEKNVYYISGEVDVDSRESIRQGVENETNAIIVASYATLSTGVNIPSIEYVVFASPVKSKITNLQSIGRGLRLKDGKNKCTLYDISDNLASGSKVNHTLKHFKLRVEQYANEQFDFNMVTVPFNP